MAKPPLNFASKPKLTPEAAAKLAELESLAEQRAAAVAGQSVSKPTSSQSRKAAAPQQHEPAAPQARNLARSGTRELPYVRATDGQPTRSTTVHLPVDLLQHLRRDAAEREVHMSAIVTEALRRWYSAADED